MGSRSGLIASRKARDDLLNNTMHSVIIKVRYAVVELYFIPISCSTLDVLLGDKFQTV
jgi:hypothetical protein